MSHLPFALTTRSYIAGLAGVALLVAVLAFVFGHNRFRSEWRCQPGDHYVAVPWSETPLAVRDALRARVGRVAAPSAPFDQGDVLTGLPRNQVRAVFHVGARWGVAYRRGGRVQRTHIVMVLVSPNGTVERAYQGAVDETLCPTGAAR